MPNNHSHGSTCSIGGSAIANIKNISGVGWSRELSDVSNFDSTDMWKEFLASWIEGEEISLELINTVVYHEPSSSFEPVAIVITIGPATAGNPQFSFNGILTGWNVGAASGGEVPASAKIKICGPITAGTVSS